MPFRVAVLGSSGGPLEKELSSYLVSYNSEDFIALDAGVLLSAIDELLQRNKGKIDGTTDAISFLQNRIKAYLISHPHLDHLSGLIISSQVDKKKSILGLQHTLESISKHLFNNLIWPNYGNWGEDAIGNYTYQSLKLREECVIEGTNLFVTPFLLTHHPRVYSTAFLIRGGEETLLYFGDTASDKVSRTNHMEEIWKKVAPLIQKGSLKAIFLECSYSLKESNAYLSGHFNPMLFMEEMERLQEISKNDLKELSLIVTHRKNGRVSEDRIESEIRELNKSDLKLIFPRQGDLFEV